MYCSTCSTKMETFQYNGPGNIVIDTCHTCDLIWLDFGELQKVVNAPGKDRGAPRVPPAEDADEQLEEKTRPPEEYLSWFNRRNYERYFDAAEHHGRSRELP